MIGATLSGFVMLGVLTSVLFIGRSGANISNYAEMEKEARRGLEIFAQDSRQASDLDWVTATQVVLTVNLQQVTYGYNAGNKTFYRQFGTGTPEVLIKGVEAFEFRGFMITGAMVNLSDLSTAAKRDVAGNLTKQLQISLRSARTTSTVATATDNVLSARYILRNKRVTT